MRSLKQQKIIFITREFSQVTRCGGIGVAIKALAESLSVFGNEITIGLLLWDESSLQDFNYWQAFFQIKKIRLLLIPQSQIPIEGGIFVEESYATYLFLKEKYPKYRWDHFIFPDLTGLGYYSIQAKFALSEFSDAKLSVIGHGSTLWSTLSNQEVSNYYDTFERTYLEKMSVEKCDYFISPSEYYLNWLRRHQWTLPNNCRVLANVINQKGSMYLGARKNFTDLVFFGRLEYRKGLDLFVDALKRMSPTFFENLNIIFLGQISGIGGMAADQWIAHQLKDTGLEYKIFSNFDSNQSLHFLSSRNSLVVVPSRDETFGNTFHECLHYGIPIIASKIPSFIESLHDSDNDKILFPLSVEKIKDKIELSIQFGVESVQLRNPNSTTQKNWDLFVRETQSSSYPTNIITAQKKISICIPHKNRPHFLEKCIKSLLIQTYDNFELLIGDDGSDLDSAKIYLNYLKNTTFKQSVKVFHYPSKSGPGFIRNRLAEESDGEYLFFMDDDNQAKINELERFMRAATITDADILTCPFDRVQNNTSSNQSNVTEVVSRWVPIGNALSLSLNRNPFGDMNSIVKKSVFFKLGGLREEINLHGEDWEFFLRASLEGFKIEIVPEALFYYFEHSENYSKRTDKDYSRQTIKQTFLNHVDLPKRDMFHLLNLNLVHNTVPSHPAHKRVTLNPKLLSDLVEFLEPALNQNFDFNLKDFGQTISNVDQVKFRCLHNTVYIVCTDSDPKIHFFEISKPLNSITILNIELKTRKSHFLKVYFKTQNLPFYNEDQVVGFSLKPGVNRLAIMLPENQTGQLRIDPTEKNAVIQITNFFFSTQLKNHSQPLRPYEITQVP